MGNSKLLHIICPEGIGCCTFSLQDANAMTPEMFAAAAFFHRLRCEGTHIDSIPEAIRPSDRAQAYEIQTIQAQERTDPLFGWKLAATSKAGQEHIQVDCPLIGRLFREHLIANGGTYTQLEANVMRVAELEFAFKFRRNILARQPTWEMEEALAEVESLHPAIELPDSRFMRYEAAGKTALIADNACAHYFILGDAAPETWRHLDLAEQQPWAIIDGSRFRQGHGRNVLGDPRLALRWFLNEASRLGLPIKKGEIVTTGTCLSPIPIRHGITVAGDFGRLGTVAVRIA